jgi:hypothetical protein
MLRFKEFIVERLKSEHEPKIRKIASKVRTQYHASGRGLMVNKPDQRDYKQGDRFSTFGDCEDVSHCVRNALKKHYPSARVVDGKKYYTDKGDKRNPNKRAPHAWVEIPEIGHYIDPTHDQFHNNFRTSRRNKRKVPRVKGLYPNRAIKIGSMNDKDYKKNYDSSVTLDKGGLINKYQKD